MEDPCGITYHLILHGGRWSWQAAIDGQGGQEEGDASKAGFEIGGPKVAVTRV
jgi:hypothetical protein